MVDTASLRLAVDARLTGLALRLERGDSNPESILDSEPLELRLRVRASSIGTLKVHGDCVMGRAGG